jgi:hypothetical protein
MRRREFIRLISGSTALLSLMAHAQQPDRKRRIGVLMGIADNDPKRGLVLKHSKGDSKNSVGQRARISIWTTAGPLAILTEHFCSQRKFSISNPT